MADDQQAEPFKLACSTCEYQTGDAGEFCAHLLATGHCDVDAEFRERLSDPDGFAQAVSMITKVQTAALDGEAGLAAIGAEHLGRAVFEDGANTLRVGGMGIVSERPLADAYEQIVANGGHAGASLKHQSDVRLAFYTGAATMFALLQDDRVNSKKLIAELHAYIREQTRRGGEMKES